MHCLEGKWEEEEVEEGGGHVPVAEEASSALDLLPKNHHHLLPVTNKLLPLQLLLPVVGVVVCFLVSVRLLLKEWLSELEVRSRTGRLIL